MNIGQIKQNDAGIFMGRISTLGSGPIDVGVAI